MELYRGPSCIPVVSTRVMAGLVAPRFDVVRNDLTAFTLDGLSGFSLGACVNYFTRPAWRAIEDFVVYAWGEFAPIWDDIPGEVVSDQTDE